MGWLLLAFIVVPIAELAVIIEVGAAIGVWPTIALLLAISFLGVYLVKREGFGVWRRINERVALGEMPGRELADGGIVLVGGTMLVFPGFVTDVVGLVLLVPPVRSLVRARLARRFEVQVDEVRSARVRSEWTIVERPSIPPPDVDA